MNERELVRVSDCTMIAAEDHYPLSFREKIELCRMIDKLGVSAIDLCPIRQKKTDRLLVKSICSAVRNASVAVPVDITDEESVRITWEALKEAAKPRLQVAVPVSSVQMDPGLPGADGKCGTDRARRDPQRSGVPFQAAYGCGRSRRANDHALRFCRTDDPG